MEVFKELRFVVIILVIIKIGQWAWRRHRKLQLLRRYSIPGPKPSFLTGNMRELKSAPPNVLITNWLQEYGKVFGYYIGEIPYVVVNDLDMLKQVMIKDFEGFNNRPTMYMNVKPLIYTLLYLKDKRWKEVRSILTPSFSSRKIKAMTEIVKRQVDITESVVLKKAQQHEMFDIYHLMQALTLDVIADCALAMKTRCQQNDKDTFLLAVQKFFRFAHDAIVDYAIMFPFVASVLTFISNYMTAGQMTNLIVRHVKRAISTRRQNSETRGIDVLQMLLDHNRDAKNGLVLTDDEIIANVYIFLLAGYETTATALAFTFYLLVTHPEIQERLYREVSSVTEINYSTIQDLHYLDQVFSESMRIYPPVTGFVARACNQDYQLGPYTIPKGAIVQAPIWDIHHDPRLWPDPWKFDPDRFSPENKSRIPNLAYIPFGIGPRHCIGSRFAQLEAKLTLLRLVKKFRFEKCSLTEDPPRLICPTVIINPANGVYVKASLRELDLME